MNGPNIPPLTLDEVRVNICPLGFITIDWNEGHVPIGPEDTLIGWFYTARYHITSDKRVGWSQKPVHINIPTNPQE